ncbi:ABC transporter ATP-binding protein [Natrarchaeobius sp. A-rgal3]|uniref:ABC transporter ATP-binding protein n=1 Tax=Natrarchaeobius versutus TaxID=1679078 RepID=UPI00350FAAFC
MTAIELEGLTKDYGDVLAADDLTFSVETGEIFGFLGPNGAGKTTTIRLLLGFISPTAGSATVLDRDVTDERALIDAKRRIGYLSDDPAFDEQATGTEILDLHASIKGDDRRDELLEAFEPPLERQVRDYSRGNVQKLGIVTTFMHDPDLVILDEPTSGLDPLMKQRFDDFLRSERRQGVTVFFSSHVLSEVRRLCDRVGIIRDGRLVTIEPIDTLLTRSGKAVRIASATPIPTATLEIEGVHDLETVSSTDGDEGRSETVTGGDGDGNDRAREAEPPAQPHVRGSTNRAANSDATETFTECTFTFTGDVNALLGRLTEYELTDLSVEEAPLEDVFLRFYGGDDEDA